MKPENFRDTSDGTESENMSQICKIYHKTTKIVERHLCLYILSNNIFQLRSDSNKYGKKSCWNETDLYKAKINVRNFSICYQNCMWDDFQFNRTHFVVKM